MDMQSASWFPVRRPLPQVSNQAMLSRIFSVKGGNEPTSIFYSYLPFILQVDSQCLNRNSGIQMTLAGIIRVHESADADLREFFLKGERGPWVNQK